MIHTVFQDSRRTLFVALILSVAMTANAEEPVDVDYAKQIKPLLLEKCASCHGPRKQTSGLRIDTAAAMKTGGDSGEALVPGDAAASLLFERVTDNEASRMPPADAGAALTPEQIALLKSWIDAGAIAPKDEQPLIDPRSHWAYQPPVAPPVPNVDAAWIRSDIDRFLAKEQQRLGVIAVDAAERSTLLRRLSLNLIGLPPTRTELQEFLADPSPDAWERAIDRLLASPRYGERWGRHFMDIWRYSDPSGYGNEIRDGRQHIWRWRDWIVESLNEDLGYDQMIIDMLAGDEAAPDDIDTLRATGFLARNWYKFNRNVWLDNIVEHSSKAFLGVTANCARCHAHKYDPIDHDEYYQLRAIFEAHEIRDDPLADGSEDLVRAFDSHHADVTYVFLQGDENKPDKEQPVQPGIPAVFGGELKIEPVALPLFAWYPALRPDQREILAKNATATVTSAQNEVAAKKQALLTAQRDLAKVTQAEPSSTTAIPVTEKPDAPAKQVLLDEKFDQLDSERWTIESGEWAIKEGWAVQSDGQSQQRRLVSKIDHPQNFRARTKFRITGGAQYQSVGIGFDVHGKSMHAVYLSISGQFAQMTIQNDAGTWAYPKGTATPLPLKIGQDNLLEVAVRDHLLNVFVDGKMILAFTLPDDRKAGKLTVWTFSATAEFDDVRLETLPDVVPLVAAGTTAIATTGTPKTREQLSAATKTAEAALALAEQQLVTALANQAAVLARIAAETVKYQLAEGNAEELAKSASQAERQLAVRKLESQLATDQLEIAQAAEKPESDTKAKQAAETARKNLETHTKQLADARQQLAAASTTYPPLGPQYPQTSTGRRLAFARWMTDRQNPLTARVLVNHVWMRHFDAPLVEREFDFGLRSERPQHADLLDWLAVQFMEEGWSLKRLHKRIAMSGVYQLSSAMSAAPEANKISDPDNHTLWRMNPRRMEAEVVRDSLLFLGGSLDTTMGGAPVDHMQGQTSLRRSLYFRQDKERQMTFLELFDGAKVNECYRRKATVAPQQALAMFNSKIAASQSQKIAAMFATLDDTAFIKALFEHLLSRQPSQDETAACQEFLTDLQASPTARTQLARVILNHNDFVTIR